MDLTVELLMQRHLLFHVTSLPAWILLLQTLEEGVFKEIGWLNVGAKVRPRRRMLVLAFALLLWLTDSYLAVYGVV